MSSGNNNNPADGRMLYFSETVCVFRLSSSLPARDGDLESSKGETNGPILLSLLPPSELQLVLREENPDGAGDLAGESSSLNLCVRDRFGGKSNSADSATPGELYILLDGGTPIRSGGAVGGLW